jgi:hypothetical protein
VDHELTLATPDVRFRSRTVRREPAGPHPVTANRRRRARLRDLCDEVLASFRVARDRELISDGERQDARALLSRLGPSRRS